MLEATFQEGALPWAFLLDVTTSGETFHLYNVFLPRCSGDTFY